MNPLRTQAAEEEEAAAPAKKEKTHFTVKLTELKAADKVKLIKEVKNCIQGLNLVQVRTRVIVPCTLETESIEPSPLQPAGRISLFPRGLKRFVLSLHQAKKLVESLPQEIRANVSKEEAEKLKAALEAAGGTVVLE